MVYNESSQILLLCNEFETNHVKGAHMASLVDHLANIKYMRERIEARVTRGEDGLATKMSDNILDRLLLKKYTNECCSTFYSHIDEIMKLVPAGEMAAAQIKLEEQMRIPTEIEEVLIVIEAIIRDDDR